MNNVTINSFLTTREAGWEFSKHDLTINKIVKSYFEEGVDYRKMNGREELLIKRSCLEDYFSDPTKYKKRTSIHGRSSIPDRNFRI